MSLFWFKFASTGWGKEHVDALSGVNVLREVPVLVKSQQTCKDSYKNHSLGQIIHEGLLCASAAGRDTCQGEFFSMFLFVLLILLGKGKVKNYSSFDY